MANDPPFRRHERSKLTMPVAVNCTRWDEVVDLHTENISKGGMFIATNRPLAVGDRVQVNITLPGGHGELVVKGRVVHVFDEDCPDASQEKGMGICLDQLSPTQESHLGALLDLAKRHGAATPTGNFTAVESGNEPRKRRDSALNQATLFEQASEGVTGKTCISAELNMAAAERLMEEKKYAKAREELAAVLSDDPTHPQARIMKLLSEAREFVSKGDAEQAIEKYKLILAINERHSEAVEMVRSYGKTSTGTGLFRKLFGKSD